ncbi:hypothetical protein M0811_05522 [Anaeramoeba ignava]|uniref:BTB domain-containing protein n=1 Tax=Anaeramoeba ignava TaxID=1746090 RepID=A0A9Q0RF44_ANAIG|nr:hypothetical protein M0811_05522 [Anaeramoeba ignava]
MAIKNNTFFDVDNLRQSFLRLLQDPNDSTKNFSITVEKKSLKKTIRVHRCVLAARSQLYRGMLINVNDPSNTAPDLSGRSFDAVFQLVHFLYSDTLSTKSKSVAKELFDAHMYYGLTSDTAVLNESYRVCGKKLIYSTKNLELREKDD